MELRDLIVTPIVIILVYVVAWFVRPYCTDQVNRKYFMPGLTVRIIGALAVGFIYQFYYNGGDTFSFHTHGSRQVWEAFMDDPIKGIRLWINDPADQVGLFKYSSRMWLHRDPSSFVIIRIAAVIDLFTFSTYSATAVLFATINFMGMWLLFLTFYKQHPTVHRWLAIAILFIPSVFFWGSGLLKDTITMACVAAATYSIYTLAFERRFRIGVFVLLLVSLFTIYHVKIYILLTFLPAVIFWLFMHNLAQIKSTMLKVILFPLVSATAVVLAYVAMAKAGEDNPRYSLETISKTAQITAYDIRYWTGKDAGSGYTLGDLDGTWQSMIRLAPQAINVALFRPYFWEVNNPLMLLSASESLAFLLISVVFLYKARQDVIALLAEPSVFFCLVFSVGFAFAVGVSTYNFGTLSRYRIPLLPYYATALVLAFHQLKRLRNRAELEATE